jgi:hypothetical protein
MDPSFIDPHDPISRMPDHAIVDRPFIDFPNPISQVPDCAIPSSLCQYPLNPTPHNLGGSEGEAESVPQTFEGLALDNSESSYFTDTTEEIRTFATSLEKSYGHNTTPKETMLPDAVHSISPNNSTTYQLHPTSSMVVLHQCSHNESFFGSYSGTPAISPNGIRDMERNPSGALMQQPLDNHCSNSNM